MNIFGQPFSYYRVFDPSEKTEEWAAAAIGEMYNFGQAFNLLAGKDPEQIRKYASGSQGVNKYKKMFRRMAKHLAGEIEEAKGNGMVSSTPIADITGIDWEPLALLNTPLNTAITSIKKQPIYVKATAIDALAEEKKKKDVDILKNRPYLDREISDISEQLGIPMQPPTTTENADSIDISSFDLDPTKDDELNFYINMFYKLRPESAFESALYAMAYARDMRTVRDMEARDQFYYGISCNQAKYSDITGMPEVKYVYPGDVFAPTSKLPNKKDVPFIYIKSMMYPEDIMNSFGNELQQGEIEAMFEHYFDSRGMKETWTGMSYGERMRQQIPVCYFEWKAWDGQVMHKVKNKANKWIAEQVDYKYELTYRRDHQNKELRGKPRQASPENFLQKKYVQNTYTGYWFPSLEERVFKFKKLEGSYRKDGQESMSPFSINIQHTQDKSAVEACIPIIDNAQRAYFKLQHCVIMSRPKGAFYDFRYIRNAANQLTTDEYAITIDDIVTILVENNIFIGDSEGLDPNEMMSGSRPFYDIPGGVGTEADGYLRIIAESILKIAEITGINQQLSGSSPAPDMLVGLQKLLLQSGINAIYYAQDATKQQTEKVFTMWGHLIQYILARPGTASYDAIVQLIGRYKVDVIKDLDQIPLHRFGIMVENAPDEEEQQILNEMLLGLAARDKISTSDFFTIRRIFNAKDAAQLLSIREKKARQREDKIRQENNAAVVQGKQIEANTKLEVAQTTSQGEIQEEIVKVDFQKWLEMFRAQQGISMATLQGQIKRALQSDRMTGQLSREREKNNLVAQKPLGSS